MPQTQTRNRFKNCIAQAATLDAAAGLVTAVHNADVKELLDCIAEALAEAVDSGTAIQAFERVHAEYLADADASGQVTAA